MANRCFLCQKTEETIDHMLLRCEKTKVLWELLFSFVRVAWLFPASVWQALEGWKGPFVGKGKGIRGLHLFVYSGLFGGLEMGLCLMTRSCPSKD